MGNKNKGKKYCSICRTELSGMPLKKVKNKSLRKPNRPYGGELCSECFRNKIREKIYGRGVNK